MVAGMNRHHFAVFVHNCRLVMLLRQEPGHDIDLNTFKPAEWRWKLSQVCDAQWHHYAISVDFPQVSQTACCRTFLYLLGELMSSAEASVMRPLFIFDMLLGYSSLLEAVVSFSREDRTMNHSKHSYSTICRK